MAAVTASKPLKEVTADGVFVYAAFHVGRDCFSTSKQAVTQPDNALPQVFVLKLMHILSVFYENMQLLYSIVSASQLENKHTLNTCYITDACEFSESTEKPKS